MRRSSALSLVESLARDGALIVTHRNADPDSTASALIMAHVISERGGAACVSYPEGLSRASKRLLSLLGVDPLECGGDPAGFGGVVVVDASNPAQIGSLYKAFLSAGLRVVIDHHKGGELHSRAHEAIVDPGAASTTEIVVDLAYSLGSRLPGELASLGIAGILYDTKRFMIASRLTFSSIEKLIGWGGDYARVVEVFSQRGPEEDFSLRVARLKAASRVRIGRACGDVLVAVSHVGSFESEAARSLVGLGADVAVVVKDAGDWCRASVRVSRRVLSLGITAYKLARYLSEKFGGEGGGHDQAAMCHLPRDSCSSAELLADSIARSLPGKVARMCVEARRGGG